MGSKNQKNERTCKKMAVLTAKCKRAFVVADDKAKEFNSKKKNEAVAMKNKELIKKISEQVRMRDIDK